MELTSFLKKSFAKTTNDTVTDSTSSGTLYGTAVVNGDNTYVIFDGSDVTTPAASTVSISDGDRVTGEINDHSALITGNTTDPSASGTDLTNLENKTTVKFEILDDSITSLVSGTGSVYDTSSLSYTINYSGSGDPNDNGTPMISGTHYIDITTGLIWECNGSSWSLNGDSGTDTLADLSTSITQTKDAITLEASRATSAESSLSSQLSIQANQIALKVNSSDYTAAYIAAMINNAGSSVVISADHIDLTGVTTFSTTVNDYTRMVVDGDSLRFYNSNGNYYGGITTSGSGHILIERLSGIITPDEVDADALYINGFGDVQSKIEAAAKSGLQTIYMNESSTIGKLGEDGSSNYFHYGDIVVGNSSATIKAMRLKTSDRRFKENIYDIPDVTDFYLKLKPVHYDFHKDLTGYQNNRSHYGFIAQDIEELQNKYGITDVGLISKDKIPEKDICNELKYAPDGYGYSFYPEELHAMHVQMIQNLYKKVEELEARITELENKE